MKKPSQIFDTPQATGFDRVTHNTREGIEEAVDDYLAITKVHPSIDKRKQLIGAFHQELQKAREEEREETREILRCISRIVEINATNLENYILGQMPIVQSELDQGPDAFERQGL